MAKATFVKKAQKDIYGRGKQVQYESKKGKRIGQMITKIDRTIPCDEGDYIMITKGESYYYWSFMNGPINYSKRQPKPSQLTQSSYLQQFYEMQERVAEFDADTADDFKEFVETLISDLEELRDTTQESLDNMPESLQSGPTGELLQERVDELENIISDLESIDLDYDELDEDEVKEEIADDLDEGEELSDEEMIEKVDEKKREHECEWVSNAMEELQGISF